MTRPSPSISASSVGVGMNRQGNNGLMWSVVKNSAGVRTWQLTEQSRKAKSKLKKSGSLFMFYLIPTIVYETATPKDLNVATQRLAKKGCSVVWLSLGYSNSAKKFTYYIESVRWNESSETYEVSVWVADDRTLQTLQDDFEWYYNDDARYMGRDMRIYKDICLELEYKETI